VEPTQPELNEIEVSNGPKRLFLASTKAIEITYTASPYFMNLNQLFVDLQMKNLSASKEIFQIELNILDTPSLQLIRADTKAGDAVKVPFRLDTLSTNHVECFFAIGECTYAQVLKGTFTYMIMDKKEGSVHEKVDFKMQLPCSTFLVKSATCDDADFARWLSSGQLSARHSVRCERVQAGSVQEVTQRLCSEFNVSGGLGKGEILFVLF